MSPPPIEVIAQRDDLWVLNKPSNISLLRDRSGAPDLWSQLNQQEKLYLVHRLDKGTSGVLLVARTQDAQRRLTRLFEARMVRKFYLAKVVGQLRATATRAIDLPLKKGRKSRYRVAGARDGIVSSEQGWHHPHTEGGVDALTRVRTLQTDKDHTWIVAAPKTGRTHQLRVHLSWIGHPIVGDHLYGRQSDPRQAGERLMLHCHRLVVPGWGCFSAPTSSLPTA